MKLVNSRLDFLVSFKLSFRETKAFISCITTIYRYLNADNMNNEIMSHFVKIDICTYT